MKITRKSPISAQITEMDINVTEEELNAWRRGVLIQHAMPNVSPEEREFIVSGITPQEWNDLFSED